MHMATVTAGLLPARLDVEVYQGSGWSHGLKFEDANGDPVTLDAADLDATIRLHPEGDTAETITVEDDAQDADTVVLSLTGNQTAALDTGPHVYDVYHSVDDRVLVRGHVVVIAGRGD